MIKQAIQISFLFLLFNFVNSLKGSATPTPGLTYSQGVNSVKCTGSHDGSIIDTIRGGVGPYTVYCTKDGANFFEGMFYNLQDSIATIVGLDAGAYHLTILDAANDSVTGTCVVTQPPLIIADLLLTSDTICGQHDTLSCAISGGSPPYYIAWTTDGADYMYGDTLAITTLIPDTFTAVISDMNGCVFICDTVVYGCPESVSALSGPVYTACIFPDPVSDFARVDMDGLQAEQISVYNLAGSLVKQYVRPMNNGFYTGNLAAGVYLIEVKVGEERRSLRFVKE